MKTRASPRGTTAWTAALPGICGCRNSPTTAWLPPRGRSWPKMLERARTAELQASATVSDGRWKSRRFPSNWGFPQWEMKSRKAAVFCEDLLNQTLKTGWKWGQGGDETPFNEARLQLVVIRRLPVRVNLYFCLLEQTERLQRLQPRICGSLDWRRAQRAGRRLGELWKQEKQLDVLWFTRLHAVSARRCVYLQTRAFLLSHREAAALICNGRELPAPPTVRHFLCRLLPFLRSFLPDGSGASDSRLHFWSLSGNAARGLESGVPVPIKAVSPFDPHNNSLHVKQLKNAVWMKTYM